MVDLLESGSQIQFPITAIIEPIAGDIGTVMGDSDKSSGQLQLQFCAISPGRATAISHDFVVTILRVFFRSGSGDLT